MRNAVILLVAAHFVPIWAGAAAPQEPDPAARREAFVAAEAKVRAGAPASAEMKALQDYPLYPYLLYEKLRRGFGAGSAEAVAAFLERYGDTHLAPRLRSLWLRWLHQRGAWKDFLAFYRPTGYAAMTCRYLEALARVGREEEALIQAPEVWLAGESQPDECDPVFDLMGRAGRLTPELVWRRIELAMEAGRPSLANYLKRFLPAEERRMVDLWRRVRSSPATVRSPGVLPQDDERTPAIVAYGIERWARRSPTAAAEAWRELRGRYEFTPRQQAEVARALGLRMYRRHPDEALEWLAEVDADVADETVHRARILGNAKRGDWHQALKWLDRREVATGDDDDQRWRYWRGRALAALGEKRLSQSIFEGLSRERSFHGFLAADRLDREYQLNHRPLVVDDQVAARMENHPALPRIRELLALDRRLDVRREWYHLRNHLDKAELEALAAIAHREGWHFEAILALGHTRSWDHLDIRFPLPYRDVVTANAEARGLDPAWVYAVVRQESAFAPRARSPKGAMGLMQLLPSTARSVARSLKTGLGRGDLFVAEANIALGTAYLRGLMDRFDGHGALATAAYNAGPHRVSAWLPDESSMAADLWVEDIPFRETRKYVQRVFSYTVIYQELMGTRPERVSSRLEPVQPG